MSIHTTQVNILSNEASSCASLATGTQPPEDFWADLNSDIDAIVEQAVLARTGKGISKKVVERAAKARYFDLLETGREELHDKFTLDQFITLLSLNPALEWSWADAKSVANALWIEMGEPESYGGESGELLRILASLSLTAQYALVDVLERVWRMDDYATYAHAAEIAGLRLKETAKA